MTHCSEYVHDMLDKFNSDYHAVLILFTISLNNIDRACNDIIEQSVSRRYSSTPSKAVLKYQVPTTGLLYQRNTLL